MSDETSELVNRMRSGEERAFREFVQHWQPLLSDAARRQGLASDDGDDLVADVLVEASSAFAAGREAPRAMAAYLMTALRNRARNHWRDEARRRAREAMSYDDVAEDVGGVSRSSHGAGVVRERMVPAVPDDTPRAAPPLLRLAETLTQGMSADERLLLVWAGHHVPHRTIAAWLDSNPGAVGKRLERLRARLRVAAAKHLEGVSQAERAAILRVLRRTETAGGVDAATRPDDTGAAQRSQRGRRVAPATSGEE